MPTRNPGDKLAREPAAAGTTPGATTSEVPKMTDEHLKKLADGPPPVYLNLSDSAVTDEGLAILAQYASQLRQLDLSGCTGVTAKGLAILVTFPALKILRLCRLTLTGEAVEGLLAAPCLERVDLKGVTGVTGKLLTGFQIRLTRRRAGQT